MKVIQQLAINGKEYIVSVDKKQRYFVHRLGNLIPSMIPGNAAGPQRYAYPLNPIGYWKNKYQYGRYRKGYKSPMIALDIIKQLETK
jgi:hypothetical protein